MLCDRRANTPVGDKGTLVPDPDPDHPRRQARPGHFTPSPPRLDTHRLLPCSYSRWGDSVQDSWGGAWGFRVRDWGN